MSRQWIALAAVLLLLGSIPRCLAATPDDKITFDQVTSKWIVSANGTWTVDAEASIRAPKDDPSHVVRVPLTWSASTEKLEVTQARIDKPDGRSVVLSKDAIRDFPLTGDMYFHEFLDVRRILITFSDVEAGDLLVVRTHRDVFRPRVPGGFMAAVVLDRSVGWEETNFTISVPADVLLHYEARGFDHQSELIKDRMMHYIHSRRFPIPKPEPTVLGQFDRLPRFAVSTFQDWDEFGKAYGSVLLPHAKVTPAITEMAARLTGEQEDLREQARILYEWVRDNVRHIEISLEESRPDPNDAEQVMTKRYGDDKDHVVLLYALLAARGIPAEFVLLNASNDSTIADPPNIRPMNHLILYLPKLDIYADSTLGVAPFGVLRFEVLGKPAIHLGGSGAARRTIPVPSSGATIDRLKTDMVLGADGEVTGTTITLGRGAFGIRLRAAAQNYGQTNQAAAITLLRQHGTPGSGSFTFDSPTSPKDDYLMHATFHLENQSALLHGGFFSLWTGLRTLPRPGDLLGGPMFLRDVAKSEPTFCYPGIESEEISLTIPEGRVLGALPEDTKIDTELVRYRSHWEMQGQTASVSREFQSLVPGPVCEGQMREDMAVVVAKIRADMLNPIGIRQDELPTIPNLGIEPLPK